VGKHTEGNYVAKLTEEGNFRILSGDVRLAEVFRPTAYAKSKRHLFPKRTEAKANADLFAAAADQNAALLSVAAAIRAAKEPVESPDLNPGFHVEITLTLAECRAVLSALAKAKGSA
jgi:hypothetical protein